MRRMAIVPLSSPSLQHRNHPGTTDAYAVTALAPLSIAPASNFNKWPKQTLLITFFFCTKPYFEHFTKSVSLKSPSNHEMVVTREKNSVKNNSLWSDSFSFCENDFRPKNGRDSMEPSWIPFTPLHLLLTSHITVVQWLKTRKLTLIGCYRLILFKFYQSSH